jgi:hypothetical protein
MRISFAVTIAAALSISASVAGAQGDDSGIGYLALITTPTAGVPPLARQWMLSAPRTGLGFDAQWGHLGGNGASVNMFTGGVSIPVRAGHADLGLLAGISKPRCGDFDCGGSFVAGATYDGRWKQWTGNDNLVTLGFSGRAGYLTFDEPGDNETFLSASVGLPVSVAFGAGTGLRVVPFFTPAFGWGHVSAGGSGDGVRFLVGGGLGFISPTSGFGVTIGAQKVIVNGGATVFGVGLTWAKM